MSLPKDTEYKSRPLSSKLWDNKILRPAVKAQLLKGAREFIDSYDIELSAIKDITFTGSMAGYYFHPEFSDIDLHILLAFDELEDDPKMLRDYFDLTKAVWAKERPQEVCGHEVEIYVQDVAQPHHAAGTYSIMNDEWLSSPVDHGDVEVDDSYIVFKVNELTKKINYAESLVQENPREAMNYLEGLKSKLKRMRQEALDEDGEFAGDNLAFKRMRRMGTLQKMRELYKLAYFRYTSLPNNIK